LLKQIAPRVTRAAVLRDPAIRAGIGLLAAIQAVAPVFGVELSPVGVHDAGEIESAVTAFAHGPNDGLIVLPGSLLFGSSFMHSPTCRQFPAHAGDVAVRILPRDGRYCGS
jgi:hypothetical protein